MGKAIIELTFINPEKQSDKLFSFVSTVFLKFNPSSKIISEIAKEAEKIVRREHPEFSHLLDYSYHGREENFEVLIKEE